MNFEFCEDDDNYFSPEFKIGDKIDNQKYNASLNRCQSINYSYLQLDNTTRYHFTQTCFDNEDAIAYFKFMKSLSTNEFLKLVDNKKNEWHLNRTLYRGNFKNLFDEVFGNKKAMKEENLPNFYHFALYTSKGMANRENGTKSPRIYFFIGDNATIYPLFYDPYHEINP
ncbi:MAG: hypothetical protein SNH79_05865 [Rikenellaceae bacterium]